MDLFYENNQGEIIKFYDSSYVLTEHAFFDWTLSYSIVQSASTGFKFDPATKQFKVRILPMEQEQADREQAYQDLINSFVNICAKDVNKPGKLWTTGGEYLICRIVTSNKTKWTKGRDVTLTCQLLCDYPIWIKERTYSLSKHEDTPGANAYLDFDYDFDYDYMSPITGQENISNLGYGKAHYKAVMYGPASDPYIVIDGRIIGVSTVLQATDYLVIDSRTYEVYKVTNTGEKVNQFNNRTKATSIFDKISPGTHSMIWPGTFGLDLTIFEERREPEWN